MKDGVCPKCGSEEIYRDDHNFRMNNIPVGSMNPAKVEVYVCVKCGYLENYVTEPEKLDEIKAQWRKVSPGQK